MTIEELKEIISEFDDNTEIKFEDVCGNWTFDVYQAEFDEQNNILFLIGDK